MKLNLRTITVASDRHYDEDQIKEDETDEAHSTNEGEVNDIRNCDSKY